MKLPVTYPLLGVVASRLDVDPDELVLVVANVRRPNNAATKDNHALCMAMACSPMWDGSMGRAGGVLWRFGITSHFGPDQLPLLLKFRNQITRRQEQDLAIEIKKLWEEYSS